MVEIGHPQPAQVDLEGLRDLSGPSMGRDERRQRGTIPPKGGESVGKTPEGGGRGQSADGTHTLAAQIPFFCYNVRLRGRLKMAALRDLRRFYVPRRWWNCQEGWKRHHERRVRAGTAIHTPRRTRRLQVNSLRSQPPLTCHPLEMGDSP